MGPARSSGATLTSADSWHNLSSYMLQQGFRGWRLERLGLRVQEFGGIRFSLKTLKPGTIWANHT